MLTSAPAPRPALLALNAVLRHMADELDALSVLATGVQTAMSACGLDPGRHSDAIRGLQGIDRVTQILEDLGRLAEDLSSAVPEHLRLDATATLARIRLFDLGIRIALRDEHACPATPPPAGEVVWL